MLIHHARDITVWTCSKRILYCIPILHQAESTIGTQLHIEVVLDKTDGIQSLVKSPQGISKLTVSLPSQATYLDCSYKLNREGSYLR